MKQMSARIFVSAEELRRQYDTELVLERRMKGLSDRHKKKARARIQGARWGRLVAAEMQGLVDDLERSFGRAVTLRKVA